MRGAYGRSKISSSMPPVGHSKPSRSEAALTDMLEVGKGRAVNVTREDGGKHRIDRVERQRSAFPSLKEFRGKGSLSSTNSQAPLTPLVELATCHSRKTAREERLALARSPPFCPLSGHTLCPLCLRPSPRERARCFIQGPDCIAAMTGLLMSGCDSPIGPDPVERPVHVGGPTAHTYPRVQT